MGKKKKWITRILVLAILVSNLWTVPSLKATTDEDFLNSLVLKLSYENNVTDSSGNNIDTKLNGEATYVEGIDGFALQLNGKDNYIDLGTSSSLQPTNLTVSLWVKPSEELAGEHMLVWNKPSGRWDGNGWYLSSLDNNWAILLSVGDGQQEAYVETPRKDFFPVNEWTHLVVTFDDASKEVCIYRNGIAQKVTYRNPMTNSIVADDIHHKYIGFNSPGYRGAFVKMALDEFEIYSSKATPDQVIDLYAKYGESIDPALIVKSDYDNLKFGISTLKSDITLPKKGIAGSTITWTSSAPEYLSEEGKVTRPGDGLSDQKVTLTAEISYQGEKLTKVFKFTVKTESVFTPLSDFALDEVIVTDPYYANALALEVEYLKAFDPDRLVSGFLRTKGLEPKASPYPGWESKEIRGHTLGHYLSAISMAYQNTKDEELLTKLNYIIDELERSQLDNGYLSAFPEYYYDNVEQNKPCWVPWYTMHKIINGLLDTYKFSGNEKAFSIVKKLGDWVYHRTSRWSPATQNTVLAVEYGGMNDCMYELYKLTGNENHATAAHMFDEIALFTALQQGNDVLNGKHANTTIPKFMGALNRYLALGKNEEFYLEAAENFWEIVIRDHTYITGGNSEWEHFGAAGILDIERTNCNNETCNTYNMLKLSRELFKLTGDIKYADYYENTLINAIMSSQNPETGMTMYFQPMATGYFKVYSSGFDDFWCCTGTGMENFVKLNDSIYFHSDTDLYVNQYLSSEVSWKEKNLKLFQETNIPNSDRSKFTIQTLDGNTSDVVIRLRIPDWIAGEALVTVNGQPFQVMEENNYLVLKNTWSDQDVIEVQLPMEVVAYDLPDHENTIAFKYGPVVLSAGLGTENMVETTTGVNVAIPNFAKVKDTILVSAPSVKDWLADINNNMVKAEGELKFTLKNTDSPELVFTPHYLQHKERYGIYWKLTAAGDVDSEAAQKLILAAKEKSRLDRVTLDSLPVGNDQYESQHNIQGVNTSTGTFGGFTYRDASQNGWFSYELKVDPTINNYLLVKYYSGDVGRTFNIYLDDSLLAEETLENPDPNNFYDKKYLLPKELIEGKSKVTIKFETRGASFAGGIFDILRIVTDFSSNASLSNLSFDKGSIIASDSSSEGFDPSKMEYTLTVPKATTELSMKAVLADEYGLLYLEDILIDDTLPRSIPLQEDTTQILLTVKAEDHSTETKYKINVIKKDIEENVSEASSETIEETSAPVHSGDEKSEKEGMNLALIIGITLIVLGLVSAIVIFSIKKKKK